MDIWDILWSFGTVCVHMVHFSGFGILCVPRKILQPGVQLRVPVEFVYLAPLQLLELHYIQDPVHGIEIHVSENYEQYLTNFSSRVDTYVIAKFQKALKHALKTSVHLNI
jgi:hypothetical protein